MSEYGVALFHTTSSALRGEKVLQRAGLTVKLIPTRANFPVTAAWRCGSLGRRLAERGPRSTPAEVEVADIRQMA